ncbi:hypothetical protein STCU_00628 [Strigomonas culicis]|uniref:Aminotransferase class V domain-containing protein n=1 Tax=Strigomonas culicis TaxID=28005 RepID=S9V695_9TRYP|nr:hypothetical protein STCU_00628 [Strigomonas culicis]|eukprot:EPY36353.1 hypothetical protein STCU_00628 [Strigomonas culicis]
MHKTLVDWPAVTMKDRHKQTLEVASRKDVTEKISMYEGFGSFHTDNVEDLVNINDKDYRPPTNMPYFAQKVLSMDEIRTLHRQCSPVSLAKKVVAGMKRRREPREPDALEGASPAHSLVTKAAGFNGTPEVVVRSADAEKAEREVYATPVEPCEMGQPFKEKYFDLCDEMLFINHGAFGSALVGGMFIKQQYELLMESEVVEFVDRTLLPLVVHSLRSLSKFFNANPTQMVLLQNATFALNSAMRLIEKDDVVAFCDTEYLAVYKMMFFRCQEVGASFHEIHLLKYLHDEAVMGSDEALTNMICDQLPAKCTTIILDYVTSTTALCMPVFTHLVPALRRKGVTKIIVDGAHAPLQIDLNFNDLRPECQPSVFVGNLHKWFSSPKSAGFMWVNQSNVEHIHSVVLSHGAGEGMLSEFIWDGTRDYGAYLSIPAIVSFWTVQGCGRVREYCSSLLSSVVDMLTSAFRSRKVQRRSMFMSLVELPEELQDDIITAKYIQDVLHDTYKIEVPVKNVDDRFYIRVSVFVYNTAADYVYLRDAVLSIADRWFHSQQRLTLLRQKKIIVKQEAPKDVPCDERIRRQGGCGVSGLDPSLKKKKTAKFS